MSAGLFASLDPADRAALNAAGTVRVLNPGEYLVRQQTPGDAAFVVQSGLLEVVLDAGRPTETIVSTLGAGEIVGEMALLSGEPRSASVRAVTAARVLALSRTVFETFIEGHSAASLEISRVLSRRLSAADARLARPAAGLSALVLSGLDGDLAREITVATLSAVSEQLNGPAVLVPLPAASATSDGPRGAATDGGHASWAATCERVDGHRDCWSVDRGRLSHAQPLDVVNGLAELRRRFAHVLLQLTPDAIELHWPAVRAAERVVLAGSARAADRLAAVQQQLTRRGAGDVRLALLGDGPWVSPRSAVPAVQPIRVHSGPDGARGAGSAAIARALTRRSIGLALSSGAAQGLAHVGVIEGLLHAGIVPDAISGTSGGALYGSMIAAGVPVERVREHLVRYTRRNLNDRLDLTLPRAGLIRGDKLERVLTDIIQDVTFDGLRIPLCAVAADLDTGAEVPLDTGVVHRAVRASISIPGVFVPARVDGRTLIDGAVVNPLPVSVARRMGADIVIAVQVPAPGNAAEAQRVRDGARPRRHNLVSTLMRSYYFASDALASVAAANADVVIKPDVALFGWRDYRAASAIMDAGHDAATAAVNAIRELTTASH